ELMDYLAARGVGSGVHYIPSHLFSYFRQEGLMLPETERVYQEILSLPLFPDIADKQVDRVIDEVKRGLKEVG
ncbi:MAG TPA: DegT/DnrJ/EryC1/StrS family aminotransferase, partial [Methanomicrobiales archaeon]|nr:DegT/DnrJ/EryC1/StrS family aminotransferase [Methanomicrobiales archaeon]